MATPCKHPKLECPFDKLSDELLADIIERACEDHELSRGANRFPKVHHGTWASSRSLIRLSVVCRRFRRLYLQGMFKHVVWECNQAELVGAHAIAQTADHTWALALEFGAGFIQEGDKFVRKTNRHESVSIELLSAVLGKATSLKAFVLRSPFKQQSDEASQHLLGLLARLPLESLWFIDSGFDFVEPLSVGVLFKQLQDCCLESDSHLQALEISDAFLCSLLAHSPMLKSLTLRMCDGLNEPVVKSSSLESLSLCAMEISSKRMTVDAPLLVDLDGVPNLDALILRTPKLKTLSIGLIGHIDTLDCEVRLSILSLNRTNWRMQQVQHLLSRLGASEEFCSPVGKWHEESEPVHLSAFFEEVSPTVSRLFLGSVMEQLRWTEECDDKLSKLRFESLEHLSLSLTDTDDFNSIRLILRSCPNMESVRICMWDLERPINFLISEVQRLEKLFSKVRFTYMEPSQFVSAAHLDKASRSPEELEALLWKVKGSYHKY